MRLRAPRCQGPSFLALFAPCLQVARIASSTGLRSAASTGLWISATMWHQTRLTHVNLSIVGDGLNMMFCKSNPSPSFHEVCSVIKSRPVGYRALTANRGSAAAFRDTVFARRELISGQTEKSTLLYKYLPGSECTVQIQQVIVFSRGW